MVDLATLAIKIDSTDVKSGTAELDKLTAAGSRTEGAVNKVGTASEQTGAKIRTATQASSEMAQKAQEVAAAYSRADIAITALGSATAQARAEIASYKAQLSAGVIGQEEYERSILRTKAALGGLQFEHRQAVSEMSRLIAAQNRQVVGGGAIVASAGAQRAGMQQLSFQIGDVAQQFALGASPMTIFAQQGGQVVQALSLMKGGATGLIGFLAGPWGAVVMGATTVLAMMIPKLLATKDGMDDVKFASNAMGNAQSILGNIMDMTTGKINTQIPALLALARAQLIVARIQSQNRMAEARSQIAGSQSGAAWSGAVGGGAGNVLSSLLGGDIPAQQRQIASQVLNGVRNTDEAIKKLGELRDAGRITASTFGELAAAYANFGVEGANQKVFDDAEALLNGTGGRGLLKPAKATKTRKSGLSDEQRAYEAAKKAADAYIDSLGYEIEKMGKTPEQLRALEIARAKEAAATDTQRLRMDELSTAREAAFAKEAAARSAVANSDFERRTLQPLRDEIALLGLKDAALEQATLQQKLSALAAEEETFKTDALAKGLTFVNGKWLDYYMLQKQLLEGESVIARDKRLTEEYADALRDLQEVAGELDFSSAFGNAGAAINDMADSIKRLDTAQQAYARAVKAAGGDQVKIATATSAKRKAEVNETLALVGAAKHLFAERSAGYKAMEAAEKALAAIQLITTIKNIAAGASKIFSQLGVFGFPVVAAMVAVMAGLGFSGGGGSAAIAPPSSKDLQDAQGTGSVLGDATAKSESIANALEIVASNTNRDLEYSNAMLRSLRSIDTNIVKLSGAIAKQIQVSGSMFDTSKQNIGSSGSGGFLGMFSSSTERSLYDAGLSINGGSVADIIANGISGQTYQVIQQVKKKSGFFGLGGGTKTTYETSNGQIDAEIQASIVGVISSLRQGLIDGADVIGLTGAQAILDAFQVNIGKISFAGLTGQEIEDQLNAVFSKVGDQMATALLPSLASMQLVGEGLFETFVRVAREYQVVDIALKSIGKEFGAVGLSSIAARDSLVQLFGSLDDFVEQTAFFADNFLSDAERLAPIASSVAAELARLGLAGIVTRDQFKAAVLGIDLTTTAGRELYASLLSVAPAFDKVAKAAETANKKLADGFSATIKEFEGYAASLTKYRDSLRQGDAGYAASRQAFLSTAALAAQGDAGGLGGLENAGKSFLTASRANATSLNAYLRDVAAVANAVDKGIFAATATADYAQLQLDALNNSASILASIDAGIANVEVLLGGGQTNGPTIITSVPVGAPAGVATNDPVVVQLQADTARNNALLLQMVENTGQMARLLVRVEGEGLKVIPAPDEPLQIQVAV